MFYGGNLTNLRIMRGLSRKELAHILNITEQAVWQYENNYTSPKLQITNKLKRLFHVKTQYFYTKDILQRSLISNRVNEMNIAYRAKTLHTVSKTRSEAKYLEFIDIFVEEIVSDISYPKNKIIDLRDKIIRYVTQTDDDRNIQIEKCASISREALGLSNSSNDDLLFSVEKSGIFAFEKSIGENIDAYSIWTEEDRPYIILGNLKKSAVRRNFDIAHELGHLLLHYRLEFCNLDKAEHKLIEKEANHFAGAFLLPEKQFKEDMKVVNRVTNPDSYLPLKKKWKVSLQVLGYRAAQLGYMDSKQHRNFYAALHRRKFLEEEPFDSEFPLQKPRKVKSMISLISGKQVRDLNEVFGEKWKVGLEFLTKLSGIEQSFLEKYVIQNDLQVTVVTDLNDYHKHKGKFHQFGT